MILLPPELDRRDAREQPPWGGLPLEDLVFFSPWTTGPDPTVDRVVRLLALRRPSSAAAPPRFDRECEAENLEEIWTSFELFLGRGPLLVPDLAEFAAWRTHATGRTDDPVDVIGLDELASVLLPGSDLVRRAAARPGRSWRSLQPEEVLEISESIVNGFLEQGPGAIALATSGYLRAWRGLEAGSPRAARILRLALALAHRPGEWVCPLGTTPEGLIADLQPACERESAAWRARMELWLR